MVGQFERNKDTVQEITETAAKHVGNIAQIISDAVVGIAREIGDGISDAIEMREAAQKAKADEGSRMTGELDEELDEEPPAVVDADREK